MPRSRLAAVAMLEPIAGVDLARRVSYSPLVLATVNSLEVQLHVGAPETKKAPMWALAVILAMELFVTGPRASKYMKRHGIGELLKAFGTMRADDLKGMVVSTMARRNRGFECKLRRTKVSGAGRRTQWLHVFVSDHCSFSGKDWLGTLFALLQEEEFGYERDYFQPLPSRDFEGTVRKPAESEDVRAFTASMLEELRVPRFDEEHMQWVESGEPLIHPQAVLFWKGHSGRNFVPTLAAEYEFPKDQRDLAGKWHGDGSDSYVRTLRASLFAMQEKLVRCLHEKPERHDESEMCDNLGAYLRNEGVDESSIKLQLDRLHHVLYWLDRPSEDCTPGARDAECPLEETSSQPHPDELAGWENLELARLVEEAAQDKKSSVDVGSTCPL